MMPLASILKEAVQNAISATIAVEVQEIVAKETRRALREYEEQLTMLIRAAVTSAIAEMLEH